MQVRMQAVSRVASLAQHVRAKQAKANANVFSSLAFAFAHLVRSLHDLESIVAQKALTLVETLSESALRALLASFEMQFDCVLADRTCVLELLFHLHAKVRTGGSAQPVLTWEFFMHRFNTVLLEAQLCKDVLSPIDVGSGGGGGAATSSIQRKVNLAKFALKRSDLIKSISVDGQLRPRATPVVPRQQVFLHKQASFISSDEDLNATKLVDTLNGGDQPDDREADSPSSPPIRSPRRDVAKPLDAEFPDGEGGRQRKRLGSEVREQRESNSDNQVREHDLFSFYCEF